MGEIEYYVAQHNYAPKAEDELALKKGDEVEVLDKEVEAGWWRGKLNGKEGVFPSNYVVLRRREANGDTSKQNSFAKAKYKYKATKSDELTFASGTIIEIVEKNTKDDGWWMGKLPNGQTGLFPTNYVQIIDTVAPAEKAPEKEKVSTTTKQPAEKTTADVPAEAVAPAPAAGGSEDAHLHQRDMEHHQRASRPKRQPPSARAKQLAASGAGEYDVPNTGLTQPTASQEVYDVPQNQERLPPKADDFVDLTPEQVPIDEDGELRPKTMLGGAMIPGLSPNDILSAAGKLKPVADSPTSAAAKPKGAKGAADEQTVEGTPKPSFRPVSAMPLNGGARVPSGGEDSDEDVPTVRARGVKNMARIFAAAQQEAARPRPKTMMPQGSTPFNKSGNETTKGSPPMPTARRATGHPTTLVTNAARVAPPVEPSKPMPALKSASTSSVESLSNAETTERHTNPVVPVVEQPMMDLKKRPSVVTAAPPQKKEDRADAKNPSDWTNVAVDVELAKEVESLSVRLNAITKEVVELKHTVKESQACAEEAKKLSKRLAKELDDEKVERLKLVVQMNSMKRALDDVSEASV